MMFKRETALTLLIITMLLASAWNVRCLDANAGPDLPVHNIDTGSDYPTIQEAINAGETLDGHTIKVDPGTYYEQVVLNKSLSLIGQDKLTTVIDANGSQTGVQATANKVTISGFTLQNTTAGYGAIQLYFSQGSIVRDNVIKDTYYGIYVYTSFNNTITYNQVVNNSYSGVYLYFSGGNTISDCDFSNNVNAGIYLYNSSNNQIRNNIISGQKSAIVLTDSDSDIIDNNTVSGGENGIRISNSNNNVLSNNNASSNDNGIYIANSNNNNVFYNNLSSNRLNGIRLELSTSTNLRSNTIQNNTIAGLYASGSTSNTFANNIISSNKNGIQLDNTNNCTINENVATQNEYGMVLSGSEVNQFRYNYVQENQYALQFDRSSNNTLLNNNFINNTQQIANINSTNHLDNGEEGNYWDSYNGTDANHDAIGDTPYNLTENNTDNYPLMGKFSRFIINVEEVDYVINFICSSTISNFQYDSIPRTMNFSVNGADGKPGFCRLPVPKILISTPQIVLVDGKDAKAALLPISNATHTFLYFTYSLNNHQVTIISRTYYDLLMEYNTLLSEFLSLNSTYQGLIVTYNTLVTDYNALGENYTQLRNNYGSLNVTYYQLTISYETLQNSYDTLSASYASLNSTYNGLQASFEELNLKYSNAINEINNIRNLTYALTAGIVIIAAILLSTNIMFRRKINQQNKVIKAYNPLELARTLFMEDVKSRGAKIDKFQNKYGMKIQTRNTLEDVIKSLEKEKKKQEKT